MKWPQFSTGDETEATAQGYELKYQRAVGNKERYEWFLQLKVRGPYKYKARERSRALVSELCIKQTVDNGQAWDIVYLHRNEYERSFKDSNVRPSRRGNTSVTVIREDETPRAWAVQISDCWDYTPPHLREQFRAPIFYAAKANGEFGYKKPPQEVDHHLVFYDSLAFLFPILPGPGKKLKVGQTWTGAVSVRVGRGTTHTFKINMTGKISELRRIESAKAGARAGALCAVLTYEYSGSYSFEEQEFADATAPQLMGRRASYEVSGRGRCLWDLERGRWIWKDDRFNVMSRLMVPSTQRNVSDDKVETITEYRPREERLSARVVARRLGFGQRMKPRRGKSGTPWGGRLFPGK